MKEKLRQALELEASKGCQFAIDHLADVRKKVVVDDMTPTQKRVKEIFKFKKERGL